MNPNQSKLFPDESTNNALRNETDFTGEKEKSFEEAIAIKAVKNSIKAIESAPEDYFTMKRLSGKLGIDSKTIQKAINEYPPIEGKEYKDKNGRIRIHYQIAQVKERLGPSLSTESAPEGYLTIGGLADEFKVSNSVIQKAIDEYPPIEGKEYKDKNGRIQIHYQIAQVKERLDSFLSTESAPEGYLTIGGLADEFKVGYNVIKKAINEYPPIEGKEYKDKSGQIQIHYPILQVKERLDSFLSTESAPEGYLTIRGLADKLKVSQQIIQKAIDEYPPIEGKEYKDKTGRIRIHYQIAQVKERLDSFLSTESAPEGYLTIWGLTKHLKVSQQTIQKAIDEYPPIEGKEYKDKSGQIQIHYPILQVKERIEILEKVRKTTYGTSFPEKSFGFYFGQVGVNIQQNIRPDWMKNPDTKKNLEIDIYIENDNPPPPGVGIEYDGAYYHKDPEKDIKKNQIALEYGVKIIHIREKGCPGLPENIPCIIRQNNKSQDDLNDCILQCFGMLGIPLPETGVNVSRDQSKIFAFMGVAEEIQKSVANISENSIQDGILVTDISKEKAQDDRFAA